MRSVLKGEALVMIYDEGSQRCEVAVMISVMKGDVMVMTDVVTGVRVSVRL